MKDKILWEEIEVEFEEYLGLFKTEKETPLNDKLELNGFLLFLILKELRKPK